MHSCCEYKLIRFLWKAIKPYFKIISELIRSKSLHKEILRPEKYLKEINKTLINIYIKAFNVVIFNRLYF